MARDWMWLPDFWCLAASELSCIRGRERRGGSRAALAVAIWVYLCRRRRNAGC